MFGEKILEKIIKLFLASNKKPNPLTNNFNKILIIRQHNQFGDLLACTSLFRAIKESFPKSVITVLVSKDNYYALTKNKFVDRTFIFDKSKLINLKYLKRLLIFLKNDYDLCLVPVTVAISNTSCILAGLVKAKYKIGPSSLNGVENKYSFLFDKKVEMDWDSSPERHVSDFGQDILQPLQIRTTNLQTEITFDEEDLIIAKEFLSSEHLKTTNKKLVGLHVGAGKVPNRWSAEKFAEVINSLSNKYDALFYFTGTTADLPCIEDVNKYSENKYPVYLNKTVPEVAALISISDLFITNDTGIMHVAGATNVPQISIFGPTNPNNWAPVGDNKYWLKNKSEINSVSVMRVVQAAEKAIDNG